MSSLASITRSGRPKTSYLMEELPQFTTATSIVSSSPHLGLNRRNSYGVDNIRHQGAPAQIIDRLIQPLEHRTDGDRICCPLHCLISVVTGVQVRKNEDRGMACNFTPGQLQLRH